MPPIDDSQLSHLLLGFTHFLTVSIHNILFYRSLYPPTTFLTTRAYNLVVHQSRHPAVCNWIRDAVDAIRAQLIIGSVSRIAIVIHAPDSRVLERWMIDVARFPAFKGFKEPKFNRRDRDDDGVGAPERVSGAGKKGAAEAPNNGMLNWTDVDESFRAAVRRMAFASERMDHLPEECTFTVAVELKDNGKAPIGYPQHWIPSEPNLQTKSQHTPEPGKDVGGAKTTPIRSVTAGPLWFECWVEEGEAKLELELAESIASSA
ncbi:putative HORMA domain-containing protein [Seiridium cardinale]|uniref:HORMA domain-containing protein n=1 Tax=Seiridium cardinale TaxID=138064 RepID=A0ABR2XBX6_9PEZI